MKQPKFYRRKPLYVEAIQYVGDNLPQVSMFLEKCGQEIENYGFDENGNTYFDVRTIDGNLAEVKVGWWVIKGIAGEFYPCEPKIFRKIYEEDY